MFHSLPAIGLRLYERPIVPCPERWDWQHGQVCHLVRVVAHVNLADKPKWTTPLLAVACDYSSCHLLNFSENVLFAFAIAALPRKFPLRPRAWHKARVNHVFSLGPSLTWCGEVVRESILYSPECQTRRANSARLLGHQPRGHNAERSQFSEMLDFGWPSQVPQKQRDLGHPGGCLRHD